MFNLINLEEVRDQMVSEIESDISQNKLYISDRLNQMGANEYPKKLLEATRSKDIDGFIGFIGIEFFNETLQRKNPKGGFITAKMPRNANVTLCEGEFNRFYIRAVCLKALADGQKFVTCYRARPSDHPRPESIAIEGKQFDAEQLLTDLRNNIGVDTVLGLPPGPNSGISIKL